MSDERSPDQPADHPSADHPSARPDELSASLRKLAESHQSAPTLAGSAVRRRAVRRRQRRVAVTAGAGVTVLAAAAFVVTLPLQDSPAPPQSPAASATAPPPTTSAPASPQPNPLSGTIDVKQQTLTLDGRALSISATNLPLRISEGPLTVATRYESERTLISRQSSDGFVVPAHSVVELRGPEGEKLHIGAEARSPNSWRGTETGSDGWIGLDVTAAKWFHSTVKVGDQLELAPQSHQPRPDDSATDRRSEAPR